jgi:hypothetical protein
MLQTTFGAIRLGLPARASYDATARTSFGRIRTSFPITTTSVSNESLNGRIGQGGCRLQLVSSNGNIVIDKE